MKNIPSVIWAESLKIYRSKIFWMTILFFSFVPFMMGAIMFVVKDPEFASQLGIIGTKAAMLRFGEINWRAYFGLLDQIIAGLGLIGFAFVASWVFGREFSDHTIKDLLALPTPRSSIVLSKFIVVGIWCVLLSFILFIFGLAAGGMLQLLGWSTKVALHSAYTFMIISLLTILLCTPVAFFASCGRGYLPPIGFAFLTLIIAQFIGLVGLGPYFPWAIPGLYANAAGGESVALGMVSYMILFLIAIFGLIGTLAWWRYADQY